MERALVLCKKTKGVASDLFTEHSCSGFSFLSKPSYNVSKQLEARDGPLGGRDETGSKIRLALETAGVEFIDENGKRPRDAAA
jgi:hypothetical protein